MAVKILTTFFMSMLPIVELRGAIPVGVAAGLPLWEAIVISIIGNLIPVPFIIIFIKKIFAWMRTKSEKLNSLVDRMEAKAEGKKRQSREVRVLGSVRICSDSSSWNRGLDGFTYCGAS